MQAHDSEGKLRKFKLAENVKSDIKENIANEHSAIIFLVIKN